MTQLFKPLYNSLIAPELPIILTDCVESHLVMILYNEFGNPFREVLLIDHEISPDVENVPLSRYVVPIIYIFCNFGNNFFDLGFVVFPLFLLFDHILALDFGDINFVILGSF